MPKYFKCFLCGALATQERTDYNNNVTVFCTAKMCGRYILQSGALAALERGEKFKKPIGDLCHKIYMANRSDRQVTFTQADLTADEISLDEHADSSHTH